MKIVIQGHPTRGKEVIQILESLGGINRMYHSGRFVNYFYYISSDNNTIAWTCIRSKYFKVYTLEEFEKEFPFKIGDRVISTTNFRGIITNLKENGWYYVKCDNGNFRCIFRQHLKLYKEMKRNITLTLDKAKEWYKKGGELKEVALQAYSEEELTKVNLPKTWEEFCENYPTKNGECYIGACCEMHVLPEIDESRDIEMDKNVCPSQKSAETHLAMIQLEQLRDCWRQGWKPNWLDTNEAKHVIRGLKDKNSIETTYVTHAFLSFPSYEMAKEFLECFRDLIEKAGDLI